jgi:hypothetical protein
MKTRKLWIGAAMLVLAVACNRNDRTTSGFPENQQAGNTITMTGCLQPAEQGIGGSASAEGVDRFVLANARMASPAAEPSAPASDSATPLYVVEGDSSELRRHVSHEVELTGRIDDSTDSSSPNARRFKAESIKDLASTCSPR